MFIYTHPQPHFLCLHRQKNKLTKRNEESGNGGSMKGWPEEGWAEVTADQEFISVKEKHTKKLKNDQTQCSYLKQVLSYTLNVFENNLAGLYWELSCESSWGSESIYN